MIRITAITLLCACLPLFAQSGSNFEIEAGFQTVEYNEDTAIIEDGFRSHYGLDEGFLLRTLRYDFSGGDEAGFLDNFSIHASGFGATPHGWFRLRASKAKMFNLRLDYRAYDHFSSTALIHTVDRTRTTMDMELTFLPGRTWQPFLGYRFSNYEGPSRTTYFLGQGDFNLDEDLDEDDTELRLGVRYRGNKIQGELMHGRRKSDGTEVFTLAGIDGLDLNAPVNTVLGEDIFLTNYASTVNYEFVTPVTSANIRAYPHQRVKLLASYIMADAESEVEENEVFTGRFASFRIARFFNGGNASVRSKTESPSWRAHLRAELELGAGVDAGLGYTRRNLEMDGNALMETLYLDSVTYSGFDQRDYLELMEAASFLERDEDTIEADITASLPAGFTLKAGYASSNEDLDVDQSLAQIVIPGGQEGEFERSIDRTILAAGWKKGMHRVHVEYRMDDADNAVMRSDFLDRETLSFRAGTGWKEKCLITLVARTMESENETMPPGFQPQNEDDELAQMEREITSYNINADLTPIKDLNIRLNYGIFDFESEAWFYAPDFVLEQSIYQEETDSMGCEIDWKTGRFQINGGYNGYDGEGVNDFPLTLDTTHLRLGFTLMENLTLRLEAARYEYDQKNSVLSDYETDVYGLLLHWRK